MSETPIYDQLMKEFQLKRIREAGKIFGTAVTNIRAQMQAFSDGLNESINKE